MLVDNVSSINCIYRATFDKIEVDHELASWLTHCASSLAMASSYKEGSLCSWNGLASSHRPKRRVLSRQARPSNHWIRASQAPIEELECLSANLQDLTQVLRIGKILPHVTKEEMMDFVWRNMDVFAWRHEDMVGIDPKVSCHHLNINPTYTLHRQKRRTLNQVMYKALKKEVKNLSRNGFTRETIYPKWISNLILVKKPSGK